MENKITFNNFVFRSNLFPAHARVCCLGELYRVAVKSHKFDDIRFSEHRPLMLTLKRKFVTIVLFPSGKLRVMVPHVHSVRKACHYTNRFVMKRLGISQQGLQLGHVYLQTITATFDLKTPVNLMRLHKFIATQPAAYPSETLIPPSCNILMTEIFPALQLKLLGNTHTNVFASSKGVITGLKYKDDAYVIADRIHEFVKCV